MRATILLKAFNFAKFPYFAFLEVSIDMVFGPAGSENDQTFLFLEAGTYAVCYCISALIISVSS